MQLTTVNEKLGEIASSEAGNGPAMLHTLQRHRDILQDYTQEFRKTQQNYRARRERENLLHSVKKDIDWNLRIDERNQQDIVVTAYLAQPTLQ
ncbi:Golgi SNAP receptor complex member 1 [Homalodisca vitripennis]|nr:Golgi SNAP receptor complex member 1 [Homalodisca vitripennis]